MFRNEKFLGFEHPCNLFQYFQNKGIDSNNNLQKRQNTNGSIKEKVPVCEMHFSGSLSSSMLSILSWKLKTIAYRGSSTIPPSSQLELLCQCELTSIVRKSSIIDDLGVRDPPLVCLLSVQNITKNIKTSQSRHLHFQSQKEGHQNKV